MLKRAKNGLLKINNVNILNAWVITHLLNFDFNDIIVVIQKNKIRHLINRLHTQNFAFSQNLDLILFFAKYSWNKKDGSNLIQYEDLLDV